MFIVAHCLVPVLQVAPSIPRWWLLKDSAGNDATRHLWSVGMVARRSYSSEDARKWKPVGSHCLSIFQGPRGSYQGRGREEEQRYFTAGQAAGLEISAWETTNLLETALSFPIQTGLPRGTP